MKTIAPARPAPPEGSALQIDLASRTLEMVRTGVFKAGQHLTEEGLAKTFGVSRTPVRHALRLLQARGVVEFRAHAGIFVAPELPEAALDSLAPPEASEDALYRRILSDRGAHDLPESFSEASLAARLGAPLGPLRRALVRLTRDGLVERRRGHGWSFCPALDTPEAIQESYRYRMLVECGGLRDPGFTVDREALEVARAEHQEFMALNRRQGRAVMPSEFYRMNASFHEMLARFSRNRFIVQAVRQQNQLRRLEEYATFVGRPIDPIHSCEEHVGIMDALLAGELEWAASLLQRHLSIASRR